jgi:hypothetical protein
MVLFNYLATGFVVYGAAVGRWNQAQIFEEKEGLEQFGHANPL